MAEKRRFFDVWIVETNTVYREVPYTVVTDWIQQGRLLPDDKLKPSGTAEWFRLGGMPALAAFLPKSEPHRAEDQFEALEAVQVDFTWKRRPPDEDEDVDMIPLIDISLVLLIFFMMAAAIRNVQAYIDTPQALHKLDTLSKGMYSLGLVKGQPGEPPVLYSLGHEKEILVTATPEWNTLIVPRIKKELENVVGEVRWNVRADRALPFETVRDIPRKLGELEESINETRPEPARRLRFTIHTEVQERKR
jgi:biopolymer transport protein ExbD